MKKNFVILLSALVLLAACSSPQKTDKEEKLDIQISPTGLKYLEIKPGSGAIPKSGQKVLVHQIVWDAQGRVLENTYQNGLPFEFTIGMDETIEGLEEGILTMKVGGKRKLFVPPELGFGRRAVRTIPKNADLVIEVELLGIK